jgi:hypothetical protein
MWWDGQTKHWKQLSSCICKNHHTDYAFIHKLPLSYQNISGGCHTIVYESLNRADMVIEVATFKDLLTKTNSGSISEWSDCCLDVTISHAHQVYIVHSRNYVKVEAYGHVRLISNSPIAGNTRLDTSSEEGTILSRVWVTIDTFSIGNRIYWTLWHSEWLHFTSHYYTHTHTHTHTHTSVHSHVFTGRCSVAAFNGGHSPSSVLPNYPRPRLSASYSNIAQLLNLSSSLTD